MRRGERTRVGDSGGEISKICFEYDSIFPPSGRSAGRRCPARSGVARAALAVAALLAFAAPAPGAPAEAAATLPGYTIDSEDGQIVVQANDADVEDIVVDLGRREGFDVSVLTGAERVPVSGSIRGESVTEVLKKVLRKRNYTLVYDSADQEIERVVLLSPPPEQRWVPKPAASANARRLSDQEKQIRAERLRRQRARQDRLRQQRLRAERERRRAARNR